MRQRNFYETHVTVGAPDFRVLDQIRRWGEAESMKWTDIELDSGKTPSQPMLTFWGHDSLQEQHSRSAVVQQRIKEFGGEIVRVKVEANIDNDDVPQTVDGPANSDGYFEFHVKVLLPASVDLAALRKIVEPLHARLSRNARRQRTDGRRERFVTLRVVSCPRESAISQFEILKTALNQAGYETVETESEFVLYDSDRSLDSGWL